MNVRTLLTAACCVSIGLSAHAQTDVTTTGGTSGYIPAFTGKATVGNSILFQNSLGIGVGDTPNAKLDVNGKTILRGEIDIARSGTATTSTGMPSVPMLFQAQVYNSSRASTLNPTFEWLVEPTGNNTASTGAGFHLLYNNGLAAAPSETGFYWNADGTIHFASAQTFPSTASGLTAVTHDASLTGSGTSTSPLGIASVGHDANFAGSGTSASPLTLASTVTVTELEASQNITANNNGSYGAALTGSDLSGSGIGVRGSSSASSGTDSGYGGVFEGGIGVFAGGYEYAAYLSGNVYVSGTLEKAGGSFKIDDPLDPENKFLSHSFVESPDMKNIYDGNVTTDGDGYATVTMPDWFQVLNQEFRYQLTPIGQFAQAIVSTEIENNSFVIRTDKPNVKVSWQVTGIRHDKWANANRIPVEEDKAEADRGKYLHPELFGHAGEAALIPHTTTHRP